MKNILLLLILSITLVIVGCGNQISKNETNLSEKITTAETENQYNKNISIFKSSSDTDLSSAIEILGNPSSSEHGQSTSKYEWNDIVMVDGYSGDIILVADNNKKILTIDWKSSDYSISKSVKLKDLFLEQFGSNYKTFHVSDDTTNYVFLYEGRAISLTNHPEEGYTDIYTDTRFPARFETEQEMTYNHIFLYSNKTP